MPTRHHTQYAASNAASNFVVNWMAAMLPDEIMALPITQVIPTLRSQITQDLAAIAYAIDAQEWDLSIQLISQLKRGIGLLEVCIEEVEQS